MEPLLQTTLPPSSPHGAFCSSQNSGVIQSTPFCAKNKNKKLRSSEGSERASLRSYQEVLIS